MIARPILGLDLGSVTGWAVRHSADRIDSGSWSLKGGRFEGGGMRFVRLRQLVAEILDTVKPSLVAVEEVRRHLGTDAAHIYGGCLAVVSSECEVRGIPYRGIPVGTVKKTATGKGNADKGAMLAAANERWGLRLGAKDHDEADARWIAEAAL